MAEQNQKDHENLEVRLERSHMEMVNMRRDFQAKESLARSNNSVLARLSNLVTGYSFEWCLIPVESLISFTGT